MQIVEREDRSDMENREKATGKYLEYKGSDNFEVGDKARCIDCIPGG